MIDFLTLKRPAKPNNFLACTEDYCPASPPDMIAPLYDRPLEDVRDAWQAVIAAEPRMEETDRSADGWQVEYVQRSRVFGFPDTITVRFVTEQSDGLPPATRVLVYSAARYGHYDFGVNQKRVRALYAALEKRLAST